MSQKKIKQFRKQFKKNTDMVILNFLHSFANEPFLIRFKVAMKLLFKPNPPKN